MVQALSRIAENDFSKGYNDKNKPEDLGKGYLADLVNGFIEENKIIKRTGYSSFGNASVSKAVLGQERHEPSGGTKYILRAINNSDDSNSQIEGWSGSGNWSTLTSGGSQTASLTTEFVTAANATYIFNGTDTVLKTTNGTSVSTVAGIPVGLGGKWWHNFLFVFGVTGNRSRLYFSDVNTPETFDGSNGYVDINADDNESITDLAAIKDVLLIFKETKVFTLTGYGTSDFTLADVGDFAAGGVGTVAGRSVIETGQDVYYLSYQGGVPHFRSIKRTINDSLVDGGIISDDITGTMKRLVVSKLSQCAGVFDGRKVWWAVTTDSDTTNKEAVVYDTVLKAWSRHTGINASVFHLSTIGGSIDIRFGDSQATGLSYVLDTSTDDNGSAIDLQVKTRMYAPQPGVKSRYKYLYITADVNSDVDIDVDYSPDGFTLSDLSTVSLAGIGAAFGTAIFGTSKFGATTVARDRLDFAGGSAYYMQYRFRNNTDTDSVSIREWEVFYKPKRLRAI